jgi:hypothetical protein
MSFDSKEVGLTDFPPRDRPPVPSRSSRSGSWSAAAWSCCCSPGSAAYLSVKGRIERNRLLLWADVLQLSAALHRDPDRLVHRRGRTPALDRLWPAADRGRDDAVPDDARGDDLARRLLRSTAFIFVFGVLTSTGCCAPALWALVLPPKAAASPTVRCRSSMSLGVSTPPRRSPGE